MPISATSPEPLRTRELFGYDNCKRGRWLPRGVGAAAQLTRASSGEAQGIDQRPSVFASAALQLRRTRFAVPALATRAARLRQRLRRAAFAHFATIERVWLAQP